MKIIKNYIKLTVHPGEYKSVVLRNCPYVGAGPTGFKLGGNK